MNNVVLKAQKVYKFYNEREEKNYILKDINFEVKSNEIISLIGPSGSGKTTLLNLFGMLDTLSSGDIYIDNTNVSYMSESKKTKIRGRNIGFVFQFNNLFQDFTALENVMFPLLIQKEKRQIAKRKAIDILHHMNMEKRLHNYPSELSGGEQQRVAIARAVIFKPKILLADEPTGNLDMENAKIVFDMLLNLVKNSDMSVIIATHDSNIYNQINKKIKIENKQLLYV